MQNEHPTRQGRNQESDKEGIKNHTRIEEYATLPSGKCATEAKMEIRNCDILQMDDR